MDGASFSAGRSTEATITNSAKMLETRQLCKAFGGLKAVDAVDFDMAHGQIVAIIGPNGSGKSTLLNLVSGILQPTAGDIYFEGERVTGHTPQRLARTGMARTFQQLHLFANMTVVENVMMGRHLHSKSGVVPCALRLPSALREERSIREFAMEQLRIVGLEEEAHRAPLSLSYGKQKMLEVARALATEPRLLLMDEPAGGLSTSEIEGLADLITRIRAEGVTVLLVEHRMMLVRRIADKVIVLNYGNKIADGKPSEVMCQECVITAYLGNE